MMRRLTIWTLFEREEEEGGGVSGDSSGVDLGCGIFSLELVKG